MCRTHFWQKKERIIIIIIRNGANTICLPNLFDRGVLRIVVAAYFIDHYCLMFDREVVHIVVVVILLTITICCLTEKWFILLWLLILLTITF